MVRRFHNTTVNDTTYTRKLFCDECDQLVTHEGVIGLMENGNGPDQWSAKYYCEQRSCPKHPICKYTKTRTDTKPPIMNRYEFKMKMKKLDALEGFIIND